MIGGVLGMGRRMAESRMFDSCTVTRKGDRVWDEDAGEYVEAPVTVYSGPCRIKHPSTAGRGVDAGSQLLVVTQSEIHLPLSASGVMPGDAALVTESSTRADQAGRRFTIDGPFDGSQTTALRYRVVNADGR